MQDIDGTISLGRRIADPVDQVRTLSVAAKEAWRTGTPEAGVNRLFVEANRTVAGMSEEDGIARDLALKALASAMWETERRDEAMGRASLVVDPYTKVEILWNFAKTRPESTGKEIVILLSEAADRVSDPLNHCRSLGFVSHARHLIGDTEGAARFAAPST